MASNSEFYFLQDNISDLVGRFNGIDTITEGSYIVEDEFGNIITSGKVISDDTWELENIGFGIGYNRVTISGLSDGVPVKCSFDVVNFSIQNAAQIGIDVDTDTDCDGVSDYLEDYLGIDPESPNSLDKEKSDYEYITEAIGLNLPEMDWETSNTGDTATFDDEYEPDELATSKKLYS